MLDGADLFHAIRDTEAEHEADQTGQRNGRSSQLLSSSSTSSLTVNKPQSFSEQMALASTERRILKKKALEELQVNHMTCLSCLSANVVLSLRNWIFKNMVVLCARPNECICIVTKIVGALKPNTRCTYIHNRTLT